jgi:pimeloyl-ACP methyl ester carboxylesterase
VCEVLPGALRFCEEGDVLALVAPRALLVINATQDAFQFSVGEAKKSIARAEPVFRLLGVQEKLAHAVFESAHDYNQPMREAMYGWMTRWLKGEGEGRPIPEPPHQVEKPEDLRCWPDNVRPRGFLFPPTFAAREGRALLTRHDKRPDHAQDWESTAVHLRSQLRKLVITDAPRPPRPAAKLGRQERREGVVTSAVLLEPEPGMPLPVLVAARPAGAAKQAGCVLLHLEGKDAALEHPLNAALLERGWLVAAPDLRATGETKPATGGLRGAPDHTSAEHALWVGRPLLAQWLYDVQFLLDWLALQPGLDPGRTTVIGIGQAGILALWAAALFEERSLQAMTVAAPTSYITESAYAEGTSMGLLVPGVLRYADLPQLAAMIAPRRLILADGVAPEGRKLIERHLREAYAFTLDVYRSLRAEPRLTIAEGVSMRELVLSL